MIPVTHTCIEGVKLADQNCGNCDYQGGVSQKTIECLVDGEVYDRPHTCDRFKPYVQGRNKEERLALALEKRREEEETRKSKEDRDFSEKLAQKDREHVAELARLQRELSKKLWRASWWWQVGLIIVSALIGFVVRMISS